jgi:hypothetical protein
MKMPPASPAHTPYSILYTLTAALGATWAAWFFFLTSHNPLARAITMGADLAKEQALKAIPQEWMGGLAQPVIQIINQYAGPYALAGEAFMTTWVIILTLLLPACFALGAFVVIQLGLLATGGASGGWKATARSVLLNHLAADLACLAWIGLLLSLKLSLLSHCFGLFGGLLFIRFIAQVWLLAQVVRAHSLGALRIIFLGLPALFFALAVSILLTLATWTWLVADLALAALWLGCVGDASAVSR